MGSLPDEVLLKIANRLLSELVITCPVDSGRLRSSLKIKTYSKGLIIWGVEYLQYVEFGTFRQRPNPFVRNALRNKLPKIVQEEILKSF